MRATTTGQVFTNELRTALGIGPRTRWDRKGGFGVKLTHERVVERVRLPLFYPGYDNVARTAAFQPAFTAMNAWSKFVENFRLDGELRSEIMSLKPWSFTAYLGRMVDSGCANMGEFEMWFSNERKYFQESA